MSGGALAADHYLITSTRQISPKVLGKLRGNSGLAGQAGAAGAQGREGKAGANGMGVTSRAFDGAAGGCTEGGSEFKAVGNTTFACNGRAAREPKEPPRPPFPPLPSRTLTSDMTETGTWVISTGADGHPVASISFAIPLSQALGEGAVHYVGMGGEQPGCPGVAARPEAEPGNLCIYQTVAMGIELEGSLGKEALITNPSEGLTETMGAATSGALLELAPETGAPFVYAYGTWAVTGED